MTRPIRIAVLAALAAASGAVHAQFQPSLYGVLDVSAGRVRPAGGSAQWRVDSGNMTTSYLGVRGSEDLGGGLRARFQLEHFVRVDQGLAGRAAGDGFWGRDSFVGFQGAFGSTVLGRNTTPFFQTTASFNPFGESAGFSPSVRQYYGRALVDDRSWSNSVSYTSNPADAALRVAVIYNAAEGSPGSTGANVGGSAAYIVGPLAVSGALQRVKNSAFALPAGFDRQDAWQVGAAYDLRVARLFGQAGRVKTHATANGSTDLYQVGVSVPLGSGAVLASYGRSSGRYAGTRSTDRAVSIGYDHNFSKSTDVYAAYLNERVTNLSGGSSVAAGLRVRF